MPAHVELRPQVASAPPATQRMPLPEVAVEDLVEDLAVAEVSVPDPEAAEPEVAERPPIAKSQVSERVAPPPTDALHRVALAKAHRRRLEQPQEPPVEQAPVEQPPAESLSVAPGPQQNDVEAKRADCKPPEYPAKELRLQREDKVVVRVSVDATGKVARVELLQPSRYPGFNRSALDAAHGWTFAPAIKGGVAVASETDIEVVFCLTSGE